jgi:hypothetical protein
MYDSHATGSFLKVSENVSVWQVVMIPVISKSTTAPYCRLLSAAALILLTSKAPHRRDLPTWSSLQGFHVLSI